MTEEKLQAIKAQLAALPPATWTPVAVWSDDGTINAVGPQRTNEDDAVRDAYFIAYAPANMAALLAHVDELQAKLANAQKCILAEFYNEVCAEAERTIEQTGMVSGAHWTAMKRVYARKTMQADEEVTP